MGVLLGVVRFLPWWAWAGIALLAWGSWNKLRADGAISARARDQLAIAQAREKAMHAGLVQQAQVIQRQTEAANHAHAQARAARDAADRAAARQRLLDAELDAAVARSGDSATACHGTAVVLADVLRESVERYREVAREADAAITAGNECQQRYDALQELNREGAAP